MILDRIVVGILNPQLSEQSQLDPDMKLETAITEVHQSEVVKQQQSVVQGRDSHVEVEIITKDEKSSDKKLTTRPHQKFSQKTQNGGI